MKRKLLHGLVVISVIILILFALVHVLLEICKLPLGVGMGEQDSLA